MENRRATPTEDPSIRLGKCTKGNMIQKEEKVYFIDKISYKVKKTKAQNMLVPDLTLRIG